MASLLALVATYVFHFVLRSACSPPASASASCSSTSPPAIAGRQIRRRPSQSQRVRLGDVRHVVRIVGRQRQTVGS